MGTVTVYAAAIAAFSYALVSFYWALGGHGLLSTVGGYAAQFARRGGVMCGGSEGSDSPETLIHAVAKP